MKLTVCIGSSCHLKGSQHVVDTFRKMIDDNDVGGKVELGGIFCAGQCQNDVCVKIDEDVFSVTPDAAEKFFIENVMSRI
jgi:NADH:ubiquinone oxidoreductase subunit E